MADGRNAGGGLFGFDISSMSGVLGTQAYKRYFDNPVSYAQGGITSSMPAGSLVGALLSSFVADRFSRKWALQLSCILWIIGAVIQSASQNIGMLCAGRVIGGLAIGICSSIVPVYQSEIAPKEIRGRVVRYKHFPFPPPFPSSPLSKNANGLLFTNTVITCVVSSSGPLRGASSSSTSSSTAPRRASAAGLRT